MIKKTLLSSFMAILLILPFDLLSIFQNDEGTTLGQTQQENDYLSSLMEMTINVFGLLDSNPETDNKVTIQTSATEEVPVTSTEQEDQETENNTTTEEAEKQADLEEAEKQAIEIKEWKENFPTYNADSKQTQFIQKIAPAAVIIASEYGIYPSVMIAQAALESSWGQSGLAQNYNNLMGTKGSYKGQSVTLNTREDVNGQSVYIDAGFSVYDSWAASLARYGSLMRNGLEWNSEFYKGTWRENTSNYTEATSWLQGRYASDTSYANKLNQTIQSFNLDQYDTVKSLDLNLDEMLDELESELEKNV